MQGSKLMGGGTIAVLCTGNEQVDPIWKPHTQQAQARDPLKGFTVYNKMSSAAYISSPRIQPGHWKT